MAGKHQKRNKKAAILIALCCLLAFSSVSGVVAYFVSKPDSLINRFIPATVSCAVTEQFQDGIKRDVKIQNTGNVDAYVRVAVVATFQSGDKVLATAPQEGVDYTVTWTGIGWEQGSDGFWYYTNPVAPGEFTGQLIESASAISAPEGAQLNLQIIATAIQSNPEDAVKEAWGITPVNGKLLPN